MAKGSTHIINLDVKILSDNAGAIHSAPNALAAGANVKTVDSQVEIQMGTDTWVRNSTADDLINTRITTLEKSTVLLPGIRLSAKLLYSGGIVVGKMKYDANGNRDFEYIDHPEFVKFARENKIGKQFFTILYDYIAFNTAYVMMHINLDGTKIARVSTKYSRPKYVRLGKINVKTGRYNKSTINPNFGTGNYKIDDNLQYFTAPDYDTVDWLKENIKAGNLKGGDSFLYPIQGIDLYRLYYPMPDWVSAVNAGWVDIAADIAIFNRALLRNGKNLRWHIEYHEDFWEMKYGKDTWGKLTDDGKIAKIKEHTKEMQKVLVGAENADSIYMSSMLSVSPQMKDKIYSLVKITALDGKVSAGKDGAYLNASREASQHQIMSLGLDPALVGALPGDGGMGAGSGSNNRVAMNQRVLLSKADQDICLDWLDFIRQFNGWGDDVIFSIDQSLITTLDQGAQATTPAVLPNNSVS